MLGGVCLITHADVDTDGEENGSGQTCRCSLIAAHFVLSSLEISPIGCFVCKESPANIARSTFLEMTVFELKKRGTR